MRTSKKIYRSTQTEIFISHRREDAPGHTGHLFQNLCERFGKQNIFFDLKGFELGKDFEESIKAGILQSDILILVIGKQWVTVSNDKGRRIDDPADYVRKELITALENNIRIIPVLVHGATMPLKEELPGPLKKVAMLQAFELRDESWEEDVLNLTNKIKKPSIWRSVYKKIPFIAIAIMIVLGAALFFQRHNNKKLIVVMDSYAPEMVYDKQIRDNNETNANAIERILAPYADKISIDKEIVSKISYNYESIKDKDPDLIIVHKSSFYGMPDNTDSLERIFRFLKEMSNTRAKFLVYTRSIPSDQEEKDGWKANYIEKVPALKGRLELFTFKSESTASFLNSDVAGELTDMVKKILNLN